MAEKIYLGKTTLSGIKTLQYCDVGHNSHHFGNRNCVAAAGRSEGAEQNGERQNLVSYAPWHLPW